MLYCKKLFLLLFLLPFFSFPHTGLEVFPLSFKSEKNNICFISDFPEILHFNTFHKFYVSVTEMEYVSEKKSLQIITRVFVDDFQNLLQQRYDSKIELGNGGRDQEKVDTYIKKYFEAKFRIKIQNKHVQINFVGKRYEDDLLICYFEVKDIDSFKEISVTNLVLTDLFEEQKNLIHIKNNEVTKSLLLVKEKPEGTLDFN